MIIQDIPRLRAPFAEPLRATSHLHEGKIGKLNADGHIELASTAADALGIICDPDPHTATQAGLTTTATLTPHTFGAIDEHFILEDHSIKLPVSDRSIRSATGQKDAADQKAIAGMGTLLGTWRTSMQYDGFNYFRSLISAETGKGNWSSADSDPISELLGLIQKFRLANGVAPNRILISDEAWATLGANPSVKDLVAYNSAKKLTPELLLALLDLTGNTGAAPVQLMHATIPVGIAAPGPGVAYEGINLLGNDVWLAYKDEDNQLGNMSGLAILHTGEDNGIYIANAESYYERKIKTTYYEIEMMRKFVTPAPSCALRLTVS